MIRLKLILYARIRSRYVYDHNEFSLRKFSRNSYKYPGGKLRVIFTRTPFSSARQISFARFYLSVLVPLLCLSFMCRLRDTSDP